MAEILHLYRCLCCHYEIWVRICQGYTCPACHTKMDYMTSKNKQTGED